MTGAKQSRSVWSAWSLLPLFFWVHLCGCSVSSWKDIGRPGPWCAPNTQAHVLTRISNSLGAPTPQSKMAFSAQSGAKQTEFSLLHELDNYFSKTKFIEQWPTHGTVNSIPSHETPFDLCLISINPTVIVGVQRKDPKISSFWPLDKSPYVFVASTYLVDPIAVRTTVPYYAGATVFWFSPAVDYNLHQIDLGSGAATFAIGNKQTISLNIDGTDLKTSRQ